MATDCYALFKATYSRALADGLPTGTALAAAQSAMSACLQVQTTRPTTVAQPIMPIDAGRTRDSGPLVKVKE